jgi:restriction system protein
MAVPDFQSLMLPLLQLVSDQKQYKFRDSIDQLASTFKLTEADRKQLLPSGRQPLFDNRVGWAKTYLKKSGLLDTPKRGIIVITDRGNEILQSKPEKIDIKFLKQFPEFTDFHSSKRESSNVEDTSELSTQTPEELFENSYLSIRKSLAQELLNTVKGVSAAYFEKLVVDLVVRMGYGGPFKDSGMVTGKGPDAGIDGIIKEDKLGLGLIYIQAKKWKAENVVGRPEVHKFIGALADRRSRKGIFITTSYFSDEAYEAAGKADVVLINGEELAELMIDYNLGVSTQKVFELKSIDRDYFEAEDY